MENLNQEANLAQEELRKENRKIMEGLETTFPDVFVRQESLFGPALFLPSSKPYSTIMLTEHGQFMVSSVDRAPRPHEGFNIAPLVDLVKSHPEADKEWWIQAESKAISNDSTVMLSFLAPEENDSRQEHFTVKPLNLSNDPDSRGALRINILQEQLNVVSKKMSRIELASFKDGPLNGDQILGELTQEVSIDSGRVIDKPVPEDKKTDGKPESLYNEEPVIDEWRLRIAAEDLKRSEINNAQTVEELSSIIGDVSSAALARLIHTAYITKLIDMADQMPIKPFRSQPERSRIIDKLKEYAEYGAYNEADEDEGTMDFTNMRSQTERAAEAVERLTKYKLF